MAMMNRKKKKKEPEKKKPFQGSIVVARDPLFDDITQPDRVFWEYKIPNEDRIIKGDMQTSCNDLNLRQLFKSIGVEPVTRKGAAITSLTKKIPRGLPIVSMEAYGENRVKMCIEAETQTEFDGKLAKIHAFCEKRNIAYEDFCLYICVVGAKQTELTSKYLKDMEKLQPVRE